MLFNSLSFLIFLPIVFILYWFVFAKNKNTQNFILILASYYFYACWDWRFLFLLIFSTLLDYSSAIQIANANNSSTKKIWFWLTISVNLGFLGIFKYYNFFITSFSEFTNSVGFSIHPKLLDVILPVGISFYTFHGLSYVIDVYKNRITPEKNFIDYSLFVCYFPLLVAGPIERATHLLPQVKIKRKFSYDQAISGVKLIVLGMFKKVVIADNCSFFVNQIFENYSQHTSAELWLGSILFAFQIYGDFSGYSDIAIGTSRLFGIELLKNFNMPYFAKDIADFWRRWHISLSSWFRDYLYIPLGGSRGSKFKSLRNVFIIFIVSGFWHGANWTFIFWGFLHALYFIPLMIFNVNRKNLSDSGYKFIDFPKVVFTFILVCIAWVFFRSDTITMAFNYIQQMIVFDDFGIYFFIKNAKYLLLSLIVSVSIVFLIFIELDAILKRNQNITLSKIRLVTLITMILFMGAFKNQLSFIYFQF